MQVSVCVTVMLGSILCLLQKTVRGTATGFKSVEVTVKYSEQQQEHERNLSCHRCTRSVHGDNCLTVEDKTALDIQHCPKAKTYCKVERKWQDGDFVTFQRECSERCESGCQSTGAAVGFEVKICSDCCQHDAFCNVQPYHLNGSRDRSRLRGSGSASLSPTTVGVATTTSLCLWLLTARTSTGGGG